MVPGCVGSRHRFHHRHCFGAIVLGVLLAALTQSCASSISFFLGLYVVGRVVTPLDGWDRVSDRNNKLERGIVYRQVRPTKLDKIENLRVAVQADPIEGYPEQTCPRSCVMRL